jgi:hypothetical protein
MTALTGAVVTPKSIPAARRHRAHRTGAAICVRCSTKLAWDAGSSGGFTPKV